MCVIVLLLWLMPLLAESSERRRATMESLWERIGRPHWPSLWLFRLSPFALRLSPLDPFDSSRSHRHSSTRAHSHNATSAFVHINSTTQQHDQRTLVQAASAAERIAASVRPLVSASLRRSPRRPTRRRRLQTVLQLTRSATACSEQQRVVSAECCGCHDEADLTARVCLRLHRRRPPLPLPAD